MILFFKGVYVKNIYRQFGKPINIAFLTAKLEFTERSDGHAAIIGGSVSGALILIIIIGIAVAVVLLKRR